MNDKPYINAFWEYVKEKYPDARFSFWWSIGELDFYPNGEAEASDGTQYCCIKENDEYIIKTDF